MMQVFDMSITVWHIGTEANIVSRLEGETEKL